MTEPSKPEYSWRDFYAVHPAAEFFHGFSSADQLKQLRDDIDKQQVIFNPIHTASVFGKTFVIDGISRLDGAEKTGRQIVDEKGNWIGVLSDHVVHHPGKTDQEVWDLVISLNFKRRHMDREQRSDAAAKLADYLQVRAAKESYLSNDKKLSKRGRAEGRPPEGKTESVEQAARLTKVSPSSIRRAQKRQRQESEKAESEKSRTTRRKKVKTLGELVYGAYRQLLARECFKPWHQREVKGELARYLGSEIKSICGDHCKFKGKDKEP